MVSTFGSGVSSPDRETVWEVGGWRVGLGWAIAAVVPIVIQRLNRIPDRPPLIQLFHCDIAISPT